MSLLRLSGEDGEGKSTTGKNNEVWVPQQLPCLRWRGLSGPPTVNCSVRKRCNAVVPTEGMDLVPISSELHPLSGNAVDRRVPE